MTEEREALARLIDPFSQGAPDNDAGEAAARILAAGYVTPEAHAAVVAERDNLSLSFCNAVTRCEGAEATLSERTFERDNAARTAQEFAQAVVDANAAHTAALREAWEAGRDAGAAWHYKRACETPDVFEQEFHEVSYATIRALTPPAPKGAAE